MLHQLIFVVLCALVLQGNCIQTYTTSPILLSQGTLKFYTTFLLPNRTSANFDTNNRNLFLAAIQNTALPSAIATSVLNSVTVINTIDLLANVTTTYSTNQPATVNKNAAYNLFNMITEIRLALFDNINTVFFTGLQPTVYYAELVLPDLSGCPVSSIKQSTQCRLCALDYYTPIANYTGTECLPCDTDHHTNFYGDSDCHIKYENKVQNTLSNKWVIIGMVSGLFVFAVIILSLAFCNCGKTDKYQ